MTMTTPKLLTLSDRPAPHFGASGHDDRDSLVHHTEGSGAAPRTARVAHAFRDFMDALDLDPTDPHLQGTEWRVARAYEELFRGLSPGTEPELRTFANEERYSAPLAMTGIPFYSLCAHHFLPFFGEAHIVYAPSGRLVGLSKLARAVEHMARRPQVQERLTEQIADLLDARLAPTGLMVVLDARHLCMEMRGVRSHGTTRTFATRGVFTDPDQQRHVLDAAGLNRQPAGTRYAAL